MRILKILVLALWMLSSAVRAEGLPDLGDPSETYLSPQQQALLGQQIMGEIRADPAYLDDPELDDYINNLGYRLVSHSPGKGQTFHFFVLRDNTINAFALPGGYIGVHTGLILAAEDESELAAVLSHEIGHVVQHHFSRSVARQSENTLPSLASLALAILAARSNPQLASAAIATTQAANIQSQLDNSRQHEKEADRIGFQILEQSGFDPRAMVSFFKRLLQYTRVYESNAPDFLRDHPLTTDRIADMENRVQNLPYKQVPDSLAFQLLRSKLRAEKGSAQEAVATMEAGLKDRKYTNETAARYGLAYALVRAGDYKQASDQLAVLEKTGPASPIILDLAGQLQLADNKPDAAAAAYHAVLNQFPDYPAAIYGYARALLRAQKTKEALQFLTDRLRERPDDPDLYRLQAQAYAATGQSAMEHQALAEANARLGNLTAAIEQLQIALSSGKSSFYQSSIMEARLKQLKQLDQERRKLTKSSQPFALDSHL